MFLRHFSHIFPYHQLCRCLFSALSGNSISVHLQIFSKSLYYILLIFLVCCCRSMWILKQLFLYVYSNHTFRSQIQYVLHPGFASLLRFQDRICGATRYLAIGHKENRAEQHFVRNCQPYHIHVYDFSNLKLVRYD